MCYSFRDPSLWLIASFHIPIRSFVAHRDVSSQLTHVKFGRITGMSSRKGTGVLLEDILNEARDRALKTIEETASKCPSCRFVCCMSGKNANPAAGDMAVCLL